MISNELFVEQLRLEKSFTERREKKLDEAENAKGNKAKNSRTYNIIQSDIYFAIKEDISHFVKMKIETKGKKMHFFKDVVIPYHKQYLEDVEKFGEKAVHKSPADKVITYHLSEHLVKGSILGGLPKTAIAGRIIEDLRFQFGDRNCWEKDIKKEYMNAILALLNIAVKSCDFLEEVGGTNLGRDIPVSIVLTPDYENKIGDIKRALKVGLTPMEPMITVPRRHKDLISPEGGYLSTISPLLKHPAKINGRIHSSILACTDKTNPELFNVLNNMQEVPYRVDKEFLDLIPSIFEYIESDDSSGDDKFDIHKRIVSDCLFMADMFKDYDKLYYPLFVDNRGRMYPYASNGLSYQSDDLGKSLVEYAEGRELNQDGVEALKFALGEYLGVSKVVGPERFKVVEEALPGLLKQYEERDWSFIKGDDAPFGFISILKELYNYSKDEKYISHKILHNDACSSGLQLIGLFTKDKLNLKITNVLNPEDSKLEDLYLITAAANKDTILENNKNREGNSEHYNKMLDVVLKYPEMLEDRKVVKTPSMTFYNYGAKQTSVNRTIVEVLWSKYKNIINEMIEGVEVSDIKDFFSPSTGALKSRKFPVVAAFCQNVWDSMQTANPTAVAAQKWMGELVRHDIKRQDCFSFVNPLTGFPVVLRKPEYIAEKLQSTSLVPEKQEDGSKKWITKKIRYTMYRPTEKIKATKTVTSSIPGIIHSADASVMVLICDKLGYVTGIHDSAGCHPNDVPRLRDCVAHTLYECATSNYFEKLQEQCGFKKNPPIVNTLENLEIIKETKYAFA